MRKEDRLVLGALLALAVASVLAGGVFPRARNPGDDPLRASVVMQAFAFDRPAYHLPAHRRVVVQIRNEDVLAHTFTVPELDIDELIPAESARSVVLEIPAGRYTLYCKPHATMSEPDPTRAGMAAHLVAGSRGG